MGDSTSSFAGLAISGSFSNSLLGLQSSGNGLEDMMAGYAEFCKSECESAGDRELTPADCRADSDGGVADQVAPKAESSRNGRR